jgi:hypothetical protein
MSQECRPGRRCDRLAAGLQSQLHVHKSYNLFSVKTSLSVIYEPVFTYDVRAGIGPFNGSYVETYIKAFNTMNEGYDLNVVPYSDMATIQSLVVNPMHSVQTEPVTCSAAQCDSYLLPGGLATATPWPPVNYTGEDVIVIASAPATQVDFRDGLAQGDSFQHDDCDTFGAEDVYIGLRFCSAWSNVQEGALIAGKCLSQHATTAG